MARERKVRTVLAAVAGVLVLLFSAGLLILNSQAFHRFLLAKIIAKAEGSTGTRVEIGQWGFAWRPFTANFYDVVVCSQGKAAQPALFEARHIGVSLGILALLRRQIDLYAVVVDRPAVRLDVDEQGRSNIPSAPQSARTSRSSFSLLVRHVVIADGLVDYNNQSVRLSAELRDFRAQAEFDVHKKAYRGWLSYGDGWIAGKQYNPLRHVGHIDFEATQDAITIGSLVLSTPRSRLTARARLTQFARPNLEGSYEAVVSALDLAQVLKNPSLPRGDLAMSGRLSFHHVPGQVLLRTASLEGRLSSARLALGTNPVTTSVQSVRGAYRLQNADLHVDNLEADLLDGHLTADLEMLHLDQTPESRVSAALRGISLQKLTEAVPPELRQNLQLVGRASLETQARWSGSISRVVAHAHLDVHSSQQPPARPNVVPVHGVVNMDYDGAREAASFGQSSLGIGKTELRVTGILSRQSNLDISLTSSELHELAGLLGTLIAPSASQGKPGIAAYDLQGSARITGRISGRPLDPVFNTQLSSSDLRIEGIRFEAVRANLHASSSAIEIRNGYVQSSDQGQISLYGQAQLAHWSLTPDSSISVHAKLAKLSVAGLERLAKRNDPLTGDLSGDLSMEGSRRRPEGHGSLQLTRASAWNERIDSLTVEFQGGNDSLQSKTQLKFPAGTANAQLSYWLATKRYDLILNTSNLALERLASLQQGRTVRGSLTANLSGQGTLSDPELTATVEIPQLEAGEQTISALQAKAHLAHHHADVDLNSVVAQGYLRLKGGLDLRDEYNTDAALDVRALPLGPILTRYFPGATQDLRGQTEIHASIKGPLKDPARLEAHVEIPTWNLAYKTVQISNDGPWRMDYRNGLATVQQAKIKGTGTELTLKGVIPVQSSTPWNLTANGTVDATLLQVVYPDAHASGHLEINLQCRGASSGRAMQGELRLVDTSFSTDSLPVGFTGVNGHFSISGNRIQITSLNGSAGGGTFTGTGFFEYGPRSSFGADLHAKGVRVSSNGVHTVVDSNLRLNGTTQDSMLSGDVLVDRLSFQQGADLTELVGSFAEPSAVSTPSPFASHMRLNVAVRSAENLNPTSSQLSIEGTANLTVTGTASNPVVLGRVALTAGEVYFNGKRFEIQRGSIVFTNPVHTEPVLNIYVKTVVEQYDITINFVGTLDHLRTTYTSDPALPPLDIINLLAFGQTTAEKASKASNPLSVGAESALASEVSSRVAKNVQSLTGVSRLTIDPLLGDNQNLGAQVGVQQRVTGSILLTFSSDVTSTQRQSIRLQYQPKRQWRISILRDQNGGYGIDLGFHKAF